MLYSEMRQTGPDKTRFFLWPRCSLSERMSRTRYTKQIHRMLIAHCVRSWFLKSRRSIYGRNRNDEGKNWLIFSRLTVWRNMHDKSLAHLNFKILKFYGWRHSNGRSKENGSPTDNCKHTVVLSSHVNSDETSYLERNKYYDRIIANAAYSICSVCAKRVFVFFCAAAAAGWYKTVVWSLSHSQFIRPISKLWTLARPSHDLDVAYDNRAYFDYAI